MSYKRINFSIENIRRKSENNINYKTELKSFIRKRKTNFQDFAWYLTMQKGRTTSMELDEYLKHKNGTYEISISKQAFSKQRKFLKPEIFIDITKDYLVDFYNNYPEEVNTYKGYNVCAIDGSLFEIPNTEELRNEYKSQRNSSGNRESARARVSGIYDVENGFMVDALIKDCEQGEKELAKENISNASKILDLNKTIIIFDRGYPGIDLIWYLEKIKAKYIFRLQTKMYDKEKESMKTDDEWIDLCVSGDRLRKISNEQIKQELKNKKTTMLLLLM